MTQLPLRHLAQTTDAPAADAGRRAVLRLGAAGLVVGAGAIAVPAGAEAASRPTLKPGSKGWHVTYLQRKLRANGYWLSSADGQYGQTTQQAVMAVQKVYGLRRDGVCGPSTWAVIARLHRAGSRTRSGNAIEIDKAKQVIRVVEGGRVTWVFNTSTGTSRTPTPAGRYAIERAINGIRHAELGDLWRPRYFYHGYAIHGSSSIPGYPASHGCARVSNSAMNYIWSADLAPMGRRVWVY